MNQKVEYPIFLSALKFFFRRAPMWLAQRIAFSSDAQSKTAAVEFVTGAETDVCGAWALWHLHSLPQRAWKIGFASSWHEPEAETIKEIQGPNKTLGKP